VDFAVIGRRGAAGGLAGSRWGEYDAEKDLFRILDGASVSIFGGTVSSLIVVVEGAKAAISLNDVSMDLTETGYPKRPIELKSGADVTLKIPGTTNTIKAGMQRGGYRRPPGEQTYHC
jgi:hypothetical protein